MRFAHGRLVDGKISLEVVKQVPNTPNGRHWNLDHLVGFCKEALQFASSVKGSLAIDSWGVDHGFVDRGGGVVAPPMMYRDTSHLAKSESLATLRERLFHLTGIAHQPFNTVFQLAARKEEGPSLPQSSEWYLMPDLIGFLLTGVRNHEQTQASTTQLMGVDGQWCQEVFDLIGWPMPSRQPSAPGGILASEQGVPVVSIASHDTGSAVIGVGSLSTGVAYLNVGTWALLGTILDRPDTSEEARRGNWTNEWGNNGTIRFLKNIPGFYVLSRLHEESATGMSIGQWLDAREKSFVGRFDPHHPDLYNPDSMLAAVSRICKPAPETSGQFAQSALGSLIDTVVSDLENLEELVGPIHTLRIVGGGSRSVQFCQALADCSGRAVQAGPIEATVLGNLAMQFVATGEIEVSDMPDVVDRSTPKTTFQPGGGL